MRVLLTGAKGQLGRCFLDRKPAAWQVLETDSDTLDIGDERQIEQVVAGFKPQVIVNCAAYTAVDKAESDSATAARINADGPYYLAKAAKAYGARFFHISTDYVFDGCAERPYVETDKVNPQSVYGKTKYDAEVLIRREYENTVILRTAWVFSEYGNNFVKTMRRLGRERLELGVVADQIGCPTYAGDIAAALIYLIEREQYDGELYHFCGDRAVSWCDFAKRIFTLSQMDNVAINAITTEQYPTPAKRPAYSVMDCSKIGRIGVAPSDWDSGLKYVLLRLNDLSE